MNPIDELQEYQKKTAAERHEKDLHLWHQWNRNGRKPEDMEPILDRFEPFIQSKVREWKPPNQDEESFKADLRENLIKGVHRFDPDKGVALSTFLISQAPAVHRWANRTANAAYIPPKKARLIGPIIQATDVLTEDLGRPPTHDEIAGHLNGMGFNVTPRMVGIIQKAQAQKDLSTSSFDPDTSKHISSRYQEMGGGLLLREGLSQDFSGKKRDLILDVYDHWHGLNGKTQMRSSGEIARELGRSQSDISKAITSISEYMERHSRVG